MRSTIYCLKTRIGKVGSRPLRYAVVPLALIAACSDIGQDRPASARAALETFCRLHKAEIFHVLLNDAQIQAGNVVCKAVGLPLGSE